MNWRDIRVQQEESLSPYAARTVNSLGRQRPEEPCQVRSDFERDADRILYSEDFRRLRHKTQVFFNAQNDHICTRMEHVLYVQAISQTIGRTLGLNQDLIRAIALGHDIGHAPFGHSGERALDSALKAIDPNLGFSHEDHSLRVADRLSKRISHNGSDRPGLNLTFEVRDGIVSHCGEKYAEFYLTPDRTKRPENIYKINNKEHMPYTMEGCLVRLVDKIAYVGRDIEDAVRARLIDYSDIPAAIRNELGATNGQVIDTLVKDAIENSYGKECIALSPERGEALRELIEDNYVKIYQSEMIRQYEKNADNTLDGLFKMLYRYTCEIWADAASAPTEQLSYDQRVKMRLVRYIQDKEYGRDEVTPAQIVTDYIAGMTDAYALKTYEEIYWI